MTGNILLGAAARKVRNSQKDIDHFSIEKVGSKFYVYAHPLEGKFNRKKIGTYPTYEAAKAAVDMVLDLKLTTGSFGRDF